MSAIKRSAVAKHMVNNQSCAENFNLDRFEITKSCYSVFDLLKMEAIF